MQALRVDTRFAIVSSLMIIVSYSTAPTMELSCSLLPGSVTFLISLYLHLSNIEMLTMQVYMLGCSFQ